MFYRMTRARNYGTELKKNSLVVTKLSQRRK